MGILVLGIDGLGLEGLKSLRRYGLLSSVKYLMERGIHATAKTCFPPQTIPAWISIFTGVNPGKHGVFSFFKSAKREIKINCALDVKFPTVYELFSLMRIPVVMVNVPLSYPFPLLYGLGISDWLSPSKRIFVNMKDLPRSVVRIAQDFEFIDPSMKKFLSDRKMCMELSRKIDKRRWVVEGLLECERFEDFFVVVSMLDWVFHRYYRQIKSGRPPRHILKLLSSVDRYISAIIRKAMKRGLKIFIISDHGFRVYNKIICINDLLRKLKYARGVSLRFISKRTKKVGLRSLRKTESRPLRYEFIGTLWSLAINFKLTYPYGSSVYNYILKSGYRLLVDREKSKAYALMNIPAFFIVVGSMCSSDMLTIDGLIHRLRSLRDWNGAKIFSVVEKREKLYSGPYIRLAPHIGIFGNVDAGYLTSAILTGRLVVHRTTNYHDFDGIFIAYGEDIDHRDLGVVSIYDFVPTLMASRGLPIQKSCDGNSLIKQEVKFRDYLRKWKLARKIRRSKLVAKGK